MQQSERTQPSLRRLWRFLLSCWSVNLQGTMEYRASFVTMALSMAINNVMWVAFWGLYFHRFPVVKGWGYHDVLMLWAVGAAGFGLGVILFGNCVGLSQIITMGELDVYLVLPKPPLLHVLVSRSSFSGWGDLVFGIVVFVIVGIQNLWSIPLFIVGTVLTTGIYVLAMTTVNMMAFFFGNSQGLSNQIEVSLITFSTYPMDVFHGATRILLFTLIPVGFINSLPIRLFKHFDALFVGETVAAEILIFLMMIGVFRMGLRRYASGNTIISRQ